MLQMIWKDYSYANSKLEQIRAAVSDIGWYLTRQLHDKSLREEPSTEEGVRRISFVDDAMSGQNFIDQKLKDKSLDAWFQDMDKRAEACAHSLPGLRGALGELTGAMLMFEHETFLRRRDLCVEICSLCDQLMSAIYTEAEQQRKLVLKSM